MRYRGLYIFLLFGSFCGGNSLCAQPSDLGYPPPPGWEYVRNLDSLSFNLYAHNDSLFTTSRSVALNSPDIFEHSTDGGKTWHPSNPSRPLLYPDYPLNIKGTTILWNEVVSKDSIHTLVVSMDLGQSWQDRTTMNDFIFDIKNRVLTPMGSSEYRNIISDIHSPAKNWFAKYAPPGQGWPNYYDQNMYLTTDAGYTWKLLEIPPPSNWQDANEVIFDIKFDYREPGTWYFMSRGVDIPHFGTNDTVTEYYVTRDQGKTFIQLSVLGDFVGVSDTAEHFIWTRSNEKCSEYNPHYNGFEIIDSTGKQTKRVNLLEELLPYKYPLDSTKCDGPFIDAHQTYFFLSDPNQSLLYNAEWKHGNIKDTLFFDTTRLYFTKNIYQSNERIFQSGSRGRALYTFFDNGSGNVWLVTSDTPKVSYYNDGYRIRQSLWKRKVFSTSNSAVGIEVNQSAEPTSVIIYRQSGPPDLVIHQRKTQQTRIALYDILGIEIAVIFDGILSAGEYRFHLWEAIGLASQSLFVRIEEPGWSKTEKIFIQH